MPGVELRDVAVRYRTGALGISNVGFQVDEGQIVALFGPNGAGKTTSVRALSGFLRSERTRVVSGSVRLLGHDVTGWEPHQTARSGLGFVPERNKVFSSLSVVDNLRALGGLPPRREFNARIQEVLELFPALADHQRKQAGRLSGGQQQMLAIARVLVRQPKVLVVDELTLGLHHSFHWPLFDALRKIARTGTAVIVVDESAGFALEVADYCYLLGGGEVRDEGPAEKFRGNELLAAGYVEA
jgi:branched-chain amino acid transport system ATP-binding protein